MIPIRNYGIFWERRFIQYDLPGVKGNLLGYSRRVQDIDFREQIGVYVLYDKDMLPVYVGQAGLGNQRMFDRLKQHEDDHLWNRWQYFSWFGLRNINKNGTLSKLDAPDRKFSVSATDALTLIEGVLIQILEPKLNKQGAQWNEVEEFFQEIDEAVEEKTIEDLYEKQEELERMLGRLLKRDQ